MALVQKTIYASMVRDKFNGKVKMLQLARDLGHLDGLGSGDTISFPKWSLIGDAEEMTKGNALSPEELQSTEQTVQIKQVGKAVTVYDSVNKTSLGNQLDEGATQTALVLARKLDADLIEVAKNAPFQATCAGATALTSAEIESAMLNFGDERDVDEFAGIVINSLLIPSFYAMPEFTDATDTTTVSGNGIMKNGILGKYRGIPVIVTDKGTYDNTNAECITYIVKKGALGYKMAKELDIETQRDALKKCTHIATDMMYACALVKDDGVVVIRSTNV
ncbi:phage major capsid protein [Paramaledivibacter caminithermalis]|jgi:N4-gp56 family major capsid protein|uniref:Major capsid protein, N4-gp56 family n=1 Tax=Paramaledivibacter caminithermalis (strain DSM 15212 / CIP 107654 / DViRD3) TaxID=1121301 RepID=A0A1M6PEK7_PARC5|nr:hypothetical protein [Paramaledivibacter caminithermalis]SHK06351.1 major capsid protein, N4-gp56 family [Paramaledivibacter caminithermalis DSM 15212]